MIGEPENKICPTCGGKLEVGLATVPFVFEATVVVVKSVPAEICSNCHEPFLTGPVTDNVMALLAQLKQLNSEVSVVMYSEPALA